MSSSKISTPYPTVVTVAYGAATVRITDALTAVVGKGESFPFDVELYRDRNGDVPEWVDLLHDPEGQQQRWGYVRFVPGPLDDNPALKAVVEQEKAAEAARDRQWKLQHGGGLRRLERDGLL